MELEGERLHVLEFDVYGEFLGLEVARFREGESCCLCGFWLDEIHNNVTRDALYLTARSLNTPNGTKPRRVEKSIMSGFFCT